MSINIPQVQTDDRNMNQLQQNIKSALDNIFTESFGSFVGVASGFVESISETVDWQTGSAQNAVTLRLPGIVGTSNTTDLVVSGLPTNLYPMTDQTVLYRVIDNGTPSIGLMSIETSGRISFFKDISAASFTASGTKAATSMTITYLRGV